MFIDFFSVRKAEVGPSQVPHVTAVRWTSRSVWHLFLEVLNSPHTCSIVQLPLLSTGLLTLTCLGDCWGESQGDKRKIELKCWVSCSAAEARTTSHQSDDGWRRKSAGAVCRQYRKKMPTDKLVSTQQLSPRDVSRHTQKILNWK